MGFIKILCISFFIVLEFVLAVGYYEVRERTLFLEAWSEVKKVRADRVEQEVDDLKICKDYIKELSSKCGCKPRTCEVDSTIRSCSER